MQISHGFFFYFPLNVEITFILYGIPIKYAVVLCLKTNEVEVLVARLFVIPWTVACQAPLSMGFSRQEYCHALLQGIFPTQGLNPDLPHCRWILYHLSHQGSPPPKKIVHILILKYVIAKKCYHGSLQQAVIVLRVEGLKYCENYQNVTETESEQMLLEKWRR